MISFVIPAHNEEALLPATLHAIDAAARATGQEFEMIVVDDSSTDATSAVAEANGGRAVRVEHRKIGATRNSGARAARGDMLIFVDADTVVTEGAVRGAVGAMKAGAAGGGCEVRFDGWAPLYARLLMPALIAAFRMARLAGGCFVFCTRAAFEATGGFDEGLYASEEIGFSRALKAQGRFIVLREHVITSGRKVRTHSGREILGMMLRMALRGPIRSVRTREGLDFWYAPRRPDPGAPAGSGRAGEIAGE